MTPLKRRILIASAVLLGGSIIGLGLGRYTVSGRQGPEAEDMGNAAYVDRTVVSNGTDQVWLQGGPSGTTTGGPSSYQCEGCDARLYNDGDLGNDVRPYDDEPMPPYDPDADHPESAPPQ